MLSGIDMLVKSEPPQNAWVPIFVVPSGKGIFVLRQNMKNALNAGVSSCRPSACGANDERRMHAHFGSAAATTPESATATIKRAITFIAHFPFDRGLWTSIAKAVRPEQIRLLIYLKMRHDI